MTPLTIGIHGDWGYGKSSVLRMIESQLKEHEDVLCLSFNGWAFEGFEDAKIALMDSILSELANNRDVITKAKDEIVALAKRVRWFKVARKVAGVALTLTTGIPDLTSLFTANAGSEGENGDSLLKDAEEAAAFRHVHEFREAFKKAIDKADIRRLVIFVDDLDRCLPDTAIGTLEAIRLFLSVDKTVFVIGADETMIEYSVRRHFPELSRTTGSDRFTRNYLEKLIQVPIRLPQLTASESRRYITLLLAEEALRQSPEAFQTILSHIESADKEPWKDLDLNRLISGAIKGLDISGPSVEALREHIVLAGQIARPLADKYVGNPRQLKRFLNTLMMRIKVAQAYELQDRVKIGELAKLMLLERREPDAYSTLSRITAESADGNVPELAAFEGAVRDGDKEKASKAAEKLFGVEQIDWLFSWAEIEPALGGKSLAPYFFVSRERSAQFVGGGHLEGELQFLVDLFAGGKRMSIARQLPRIRELTPESAGSILDALIDAVSQRGEYDAQPDEFRALDLLSNDRPALQDRIIGLLDQLPIATLGVWAPVFALSIAKQENAKVLASKLIDRWSKQTENVMLAKAAQVATQIAKP
jgi:hypothetical protein